MRGNGHNTVPSSYRKGMHLEHKQYWHNALENKFVSSYKLETSYNIYQ